MWIKTTSEPVMHDEPHLGNMTEHELMEDEGEALELLLTYMADQQEVPTSFYAIDDYSDEDIDLKTIDYLTDAQITNLKAAFELTDGWDEDSLRVILG